LRVRGTLIALVLLVTPAAGEAWGFVAHRLVHLRAIVTLPFELRPFFEANAAYLAEHSIDPDLWRAAGKPDEGPNHFLDLDAFGDIPRSEAEHLARHGREALERGRLPWRVGEVYRELVEAYRAKDSPRVLERAAVLGHYVADAHVPFHATLNYDGQLTSQKGIHARWESTLVERFLAWIDPGVVPPPAQEVQDPERFVLDVLKESSRQVQDALASDRDSVKPDEPQGYGDAYYARLYAREGERVRLRLIASASGVGSLWMSAWEEAGRPKLDLSFRAAAEITSPSK
jgi:hypothetical protein